MNNWLLFYTTRNYAEASIIQGMPEENNIQAIVFNRQDSSYINFGEIELYVPPHFIDIAKRLLDKALLN